MGVAKELNFMFKVKIYPTKEGDYQVFVDKPFLVGKEKIIHSKPKKKSEDVFVSEVGEVEL
jgi:hypothetical protein